jgi:hypothetical protein
METQITKICKDCGITKPQSAFYRNPKKVCGHDSSCKKCRCLQAKMRRLTNACVQEYDRMRAKTPARRKHGRIITDNWRKQHPDAYRAQNAVNNAIRDKKLIKQPCELCGTTEHVHGHHKDYAKPLEITWLCAKCHHRVHAIFPELGGNYAEQ